MTILKKNQPVTVKGTKTHPERRPGKYIATHPGHRGAFIEVQLEGSTSTNRFRESQVEAA